MSPYKCCQHTFSLALLLLLLSCRKVAGILGKSQMCEVETGQTNIILDIEESRGDFIGQQTIPAELPIYGDPDTEIALDLVFSKGNPIFFLNGKKLQLLQPLDRDEENLSHIVFQVSCTIRSSGKKRNIPIIVRVSDVNDNAPRFMNTPYEVTVPEGNPIFFLNGKKLQLLQPLDRDEENLSHIVFQVSCTIRSSGKKRNIPIIVRVSDVNDNAPRFMNTPYEVTVPESTPVGTTIFRNIQALDKDAGVNGLVEYFIVEGNSNATEDEKLTTADGYGTFTISFPHQGQVTVAKTLDYEKIQRYYLTIVASVSSNKHINIFMGH
ncbi:cadherin-99C-like [Teleopsis dalmanni]|uniref:cadherin-99C-like n=1 Tax=Teleopsis dalmanni TaxID=139649 RepID=UPI0018CCAD4E|nr:cadherin-99C-like [Teleopsis dalmanni]